MFTMFSFTSRTSTPFGSTGSRSFSRPTAAASNAASNAAGNATTPAGGSQCAPSREVLLFTSGTTLVTSLRVVIGGRSYSPEDITGVAAGRTPRDLDGPFAALFAGLFAAGLGVLACARFIQLDGHNWLALPVASAVVAAGVAAAAWGLVRWYRSKPQHTVLLDTPCGRQVALTHPSAGYVGRIVAAIQAAVGTVDCNGRGRTERWQRQQR